MQLCTPHEFARKWPGTLRPTALPFPTPRLPDDCFRTLVDIGLPREITIHCYNDITLTFTGSVTPLAEIWARDLQRGYKMGPMPNEWNCFWHLADQEYCQGGGWICIDAPSGRLVVIDLDLSTPIYLVNSSIGNFFTTLAYFLEWTSQSEVSPTNISNLREALLQQDCIPAEELEPFWINFLDATLDYNLMTLAVNINVQNA